MTSLAIRDEATIRSEVLKPKYCKGKILDEPTNIDPLLPDSCAKPGDGANSTARPYG